MAPHPAKTTPSQRRLAREQQSAARRARALAMRQAGATLAEIGAELGVGREQARQAVLKAERLIERPHWADALPTRARTFLRLRDLSELPEAEAAQAVAKLTRKQVKAEPNLGRGALTALEGWLATHRLTWREEPPTAKTRQSGEHKGASVMLAP